MALPKSELDGIYKLDNELAFRVCKVLGNPQRLQILQELAYKTMTVNEIAKKFNIAQSTATVHIQGLQKAGLLKVTANAGAKGGQCKLCSLACEGILVRFGGNAGKREQSMEVGYYADYLVEPETCGMNSTTRQLVRSLSGFTNPERADAQVVFAGGASSFEYRFPMMPAAEDATGIEISAEVCSEYPNCKNDYRSDISLWVEDSLIGVFHSPGDMGHRRGRFTPSWVPLTWTQYGFLVKWKIDYSGCWVNNKKVSAKPVYKDLKLSKLNEIRVRIGVDKKAKHKGGVNIFGKYFGDFDQDIVLKWI